MTSNESNENLQYLRSLLVQYSKWREEIPANRQEWLRGIAEDFLEEDLSDDELDQMLSTEELAQEFLTVLQNVIDEQETHNPEIELLDYHNALRMQQEAIVLCLGEDENDSFSILFDPVVGGLTLLTSEPHGETTSFEMAHGNEARATITHHRNVEHFRLQVTVAVEGDDRFFLQISFEPLDPLVEPDKCHVQLFKTTDSSSVSVVDIRQRKVEFEDLTLGDYRIEVTSEGRMVDYFRMKLEVKS
jgi:hypothetical protein